MMWPFTKVIIFCFTKQYYYTHTQQSLTHLGSHFWKNCEMADIYTLGIQHCSVWFCVFTSATAVWKGLTSLTLKSHHLESFYFKENSLRWTLVKNNILSSWCAPRSFGATTIYHALQFQSALKLLFHTQYSSLLLSLLWSTKPLQLVFMFTYAESEECLILQSQQDYTGLQYIIHSQFYSGHFLSIDIPLS